MAGFFQKLCSCTRQQEDDDNDNVNEWKHESAAKHTADRRDLQAASAPIPRSLSSLEQPRSEQAHSDSTNVPTKAQSYTSSSHKLDQDPDEIAPIRTPTYTSSVRSCGNVKDALEDRRKMFERLRRPGTSDGLPPAPPPKDPVKVAPAYMAEQQYAPVELEGCARPRVELEDSQIPTPVEKTVQQEPVELADRSDERPREGQ